MSVATAPVTTADLLNMPDDGVERWLIRGELREKHSNNGDVPVTIRNRFHSRVLIRVGQVLSNWLDGQPEPRGQVLGGEAGVRLDGDAETTVGVDVVYVSSGVIAEQTDETTLIDGVPILAVEILSPSDTQEDVHEKVAEYLRVGVSLVWIVDPDDQTVKVYRPDALPVMFNCGQEIDANPSLPGFRVPVARLFK